MKKPEDQKDALTAAAKAIGSTLGKIAVKTGIAKPTEKPAKPATAKRKVPVVPGAAYSTGATLGKLAIETGLATPPPSKPKAIRKRAANAAPTTRKAPAKKASAKRTPTRAKKTK